MCIAANRVYLDSLYYAQFRLERRTYMPETSL